MTLTMESYDKSYDSNIVKCIQLTKSGVYSKQIISYDGIINT